MAHEKLRALGYAGSERTTRRAVASVKDAYRAGKVRVHRPWVTEPGMWLQYDYGDGPVVDGARTVLFVAWLAWSRFRVVIPARYLAGILDRTPPEPSGERCERTETPMSVRGIRRWTAGEWAASFRPE